MQKVLITGTSRGIGFALTRHYLQQGSTVFATCRNPDKAQALQALQSEYGAQLIIVPLEVTDETDLQRAFQLVRQHTDGLDVLINNAGIGRPTQYVHEIATQDFLDTMMINTLAPLHVIGTFLPLLEQRSGAKIVNLTATTRDISALVLRRQISHTLLASRYALNALTKLMAMELGDRGVVVVALWPGYIQTDLNGMNAAATPPDEAIPVVIDLISRLTAEHNGHGLLPDGRTFF